MTSDAVAAPERERPLRADAAANRRRVLEAAREAFAAEGVGVPVDEVARRAGVGVGTVYRHFPTKEDLIEAVVIDHVADLVATAAHLAGEEDAGSALERYLDELAVTVSTKRDLSEALASAGVDLKVRAGDLMEELHRRTAVLVARAQAAGAVRDDVDADEVFTLVHGTCMAAGHAGTDPASVRRLLGVILDGLRPPGAEGAQARSSST